MTTPEAAIRLVDAGKRYTKYEDQPMLVTAALRLRSRSRRSKLWAVRHVNLAVAEGETLGVIGRNGSGKSTMLQMLAGVTAPTEGLVEVRGRVAPLVSVGVGFHPELTGRENVYINGIILGLTREEIDERFDSILAFSEIGEFIDTPVKFYSSGMYVRLGFSVAIQAEPDVLLVDEVLAVGDLAFQLKCFDHMMAIRRRGVTIVVVSHNLNAIRMMCDRTLLLNKGEVLFDGPTPEAIASYHEVLDEPRELDSADVRLPAEARAGGAVEEFELIGPGGVRARHFRTGDPIRVRFVARLDEEIAGPVFAIVLNNDAGIQVFREILLPDTLGAYRPGDRVCVEIDLRCELSTGSYAIAAGLNAPDMTTGIAWARPLPFFVAGRPQVSGLIDLDPTFRIVQPTGRTKVISELG